MAKHIMLAGTTSRREYIFIQDSSSTVGAGRTGLTNLTAGWKVYYVRPGAAPLSITLSAAVAATAAYSSTSFSEVDATNLPGVYRFDIPDAVFAAGADKAILMLSGPTNVAPVVLEYQLTAAGESWIASGVWQAQLATYATAGTNEVFGTDTYGTKIARTVSPNRPFVVNTNNGVTVGGFNNNAIVAGAFATDSITANAIATDAITSAELATSAVDEIVNSVWANATRTITGTTTGAITSTSFAANALDAVWSTTTRTITGTSNSAITNLSFAAGAIDASAIAVDAITSAELATSAVTEIVDAVWDKNISAYVTAGLAGTYLVNAGSAGNPWLTNISNATTYPTATTAGGFVRNIYTETTGLINSLLNLPLDVWTTVGTVDSGTYGQFSSYSMVDVMALLAKGYCPVFGTVQASPSPTQTTIKSSLTGYLNSAFNDQTIVFLQGSSIAGSCTLISSSNASGNLVFDEPLHQQPAVGDEFMILPMHVHLRGAIADKLLGRSIAGAADGGRTVTSALRVLRNKTSITGSTLTVYQEDDGISLPAAWTANLTTDAAAIPVTGIDPT